MGGLRAAHSLFQRDLVPVDLFYSFSRNKGHSYHMETWIVNPDSDGENAGESVTRWGQFAFLRLLAGRWDRG